MLHFWVFSVLFSLSLGMMLSPENLVILGQQAGASGRVVFLGLAVAAALHFLTARTYGHGFGTLDHSGGEVQFSQTSRPSLAVVLSLASRGGLALWGVTAFLVTAGYVFSETFMPSSPNLGISFTLLGVLVALNLLGTRVAGIFQVVFVGAALGGMLALIIMGLLGSLEPLAQSQASGLAWKQGLAQAPIFLFPFIGYELSGFLWERIGEDARNPAGPMLVGIITAFCLFSLWCFLSLRYVPSLKLQESTVPYAHVAIAIAGETGVQLLGVILLAGSLAAANALLLAVPLMASGLPPAGLLPLILRGRIFILLLLAGGVALVMALGLGGSPKLPLFLKASALLWLLTYARQHLATWLEKDSGLNTAESTPVAIICVLALVAAVALALITDPEIAILGIYMLLVVGALFLLSFIPYGTDRQIFRGIA